MRERRIGTHQVLLAVAGATMALAPSHFAGIGNEIPAAEVMVMAKLGAEMREKPAGPQ
jgi:hypothetical protein